MKHTGRFTIILLVAALALLPSCSAPPQATQPTVTESLPPCTAEARAGIILTTLDSISGQEIAATAIVAAQDWPYIERAIAAPPQYSLAFEREGSYVVTVQLPGYQPWRANNVMVQRDRCHVVTVRLTARLVP